MANNIGGKPPAFPISDRVDTPAPTTETAGAKPGAPTLSTRGPLSSTLMQPADSLRHAVAKGDFFMAYREIHRNPSSIDDIDPVTRRTPLQDAQSGDHGHIVKLLVSAGARVHPIAPGSRPSAVSLYAAAEKGDPGLLAVALATSKADLDAPDLLSGLTPLQFAIRGRHLGAMEMLLMAGADPDEPDKDGNTPLFDAMTWRSADMIKVLLDHGADASQLDPHGRTTLMRAQELVLGEDIVLLLKRHGA